MQNKLNDKLSYYNSRNYFEKQPFNELMYQMSNFNPEGINYNNWIKFRKSTVEQIKNIRPEGLFLLPGLLSHPYTINKESLQTSLTMINKHVEMDNMLQLKMCLILLQENGFIRMSGFDDKIHQQTVFNIYILYNSDETYDISDNDYWKPIPTDYINKCLLTLNPIEVCIVFTLIVNQNFYIPRHKDDKDIGRKYYFFYTSYAYPELFTMSELFDCSRQNIRNHIISLANKGILTYTFNGNQTYNDDGELVNPNYQYRIKLLCRTEYIHMMNTIGEMYDKRDDKIKNKIRKNFELALRSDIQSQCRPHDYIYVNFKSKINELSNIINNRDVCEYNIFINNTPQLIIDLDNQNIKPVQKKKPIEKKKEKFTFKQLHEHLKDKQLINNDRMINIFNHEEMRGDVF